MHRTSAIACLILSTTTGFAADPAPGPVDLDKLPANEWVTLKEVGGLSAYGTPVYVPTRSQWLQWNIGDKVMRAFDVSTGRWAADHAVEKAKASPGDFVGRALKGKSWKANKEFQGYGRVMHAGCWDSKRKRVVYSLRYMMIAYDPATKTWSDLAAKTAIGDKTLSGGPPAYGAGMCYDPVNDEIVLCPHWCAPLRFGGIKNTERVAVDGRVSNHFGTLIYTPSDNTWRRPGETFGDAEMRRKRNAALEQCGALSRELDTLHAARRKPGADARAITEDIEERVAKWRALDAKLDDELLLEPPTRCGAPMVYHEALKSIVLFGGRDGLVRTDLGHRTGPRALNDTWVYDCAKRQWRELDTPGRPAGKHRPAFFYDPGSKLCLLVDFVEGNRRRKTKARVRLWSLDVAKGEWALRDEQEWNGGVPMSSGRGSGSPKSRTPTYEVMYDPVRRVILMQEGKMAHTFRLDLSALPKKPAPEWSPGPPVKPQTIPPDDPAWMEKLKNLPANTWTETGRRIGGRAWGNVACDPVRGHVYYFGGGHSSYQVNDVAIYVVGANRWALAAGDHNDYIPPTNWGGIAMGYRGGKFAHHQRNAYVAVDGRMFVSVHGPAWFYDMDRGGVWRYRPLDERTVEKGALGESAVHLVAPDGRVFGFGGRNMISRMAKPHPNRSGFSVYDSYANTLTIRDVKPPFPAYLYENGPVCTIADRNAIFYYQGRGPVSWLFDIATATFKNLKPKRQPPSGDVRVAEYIDGQNAVLAVITNRAKKKRAEHWVYSFDQNTWAPMKYNSRAVSVSGPYGQLAYVAKYGVFVNLPRAQVMRPDVSVVDWDAPAPE